MLTHEEIYEAAMPIIKKYPIKSISYFGSYASGNATENSDLDILVEFYESDISLLVLIDIKNQLESILKIPVDVIHAPLKPDSLLTIGKVIQVYAA